MNKFEKLRQIVNEVGTFLRQNPTERAEDLRVRGQLPPSPNPDVPLTGRVRVLLAVEATVPINNETEFAFSTALDDAVAELARDQWRVDTWETWVQYLDGPAAGLIT